MNVMNRVVMVFLLLVVMALCTLVLIIPVPVLEVIEQQSGLLSDALDGQPVYVLLPTGIVLALVLDFVFAFLIFLEVRRSPRRAIHVEKAAGGEVLVSITSIADRVKYESNQLAGVLRTRPKVSGRRNGVVVELDVETATGISVPEKAEQIVTVAQRVVEEDMGLKLARPPRVNLRVVPYPKGGTAPIEGAVSPPVARPEPQPVVEPEPVVPAPKPGPASFVEPEEWSPVDAGLAVEPQPEVEPGSEEDELPDLSAEFGPFGEVE
jgi:hypothetical protein